MCLWVGFETRTVKLARGKNYLDGLKRICEFWSYKKSNSQTRESKSQCHLFGFCKHLRGHVFFLFFIFIFFTRKSESSHLPHLRLIFIYIQSDAKHLSPDIFAHSVIFFYTDRKLQRGPWPYFQFSNLNCEIGRFFNWSRFYNDIARTKVEKILWIGQIKGKMMRGEAA